MLKEKERCIVCEMGGRPPKGFWNLDHPLVALMEEDEGCQVCRGWDCCSPNSGSEICHDCGESYCPSCGRWEPNCQRGA